MSSVLRRTGGAGIVAGSLAAVVVMASPAFAAVAQDDQTQLVHVTQSSTDPSTGWIEQAYDCTVDEPFTTPSQDYELGPGNPTLGAGSHVLTTGQYFGQTELYRTAQFDGTLVSDIQRLSYSTFATSTKASDGNFKQPAYLRLSIDSTGGTNPDTTLNYEPANNGTPADDKWQNWDTTGGQWRNVDTNEMTTLAAFATAHPSATVANNGNGGGVAMIAGCAGPSQENGLFGVDRFAITTADTSELFDFDPSVDTNSTDVTVTNDNLDGWNAAAYNDTADINPPNQGMAFGPGNPPLGIGSHRLTLGNDPNEVEIWRSPELDGVNVGDIRTLNYSTYEQPGADAVGVQQPAYMRLSIDPGDGSDPMTLFYEPSIDHTGQNDIQNGAWQTWNTADELWSTDGGPSNLTTLAAISAKYPNATVFTPQNAAGNGGLSLVVGASGDTQLNSNFYVDDVEADYFHGAGPDADKTFDFEPTVAVPTINAPSVVLGRHRVAITGNADPNAPLALFEKQYGESGFSQVATTAAADDGSYVFHRTVESRTAFYVRSYDRANSSVAVVRVRINPHFRLSTTTGKVHMRVHTSPVVGNQTVKFYRRLADGSRHLLATRTTNGLGRAYATINWASGHRITVFATVTAPAGLLPGHSKDHTIRVA